MFGIRKKKKEELSDFDKIMNEFNSDMVNIKTTEQYDNINKAYTDIKACYEDKIDNKDLDITIEKIRIKRNLGIHPNNTVSFSIAYLIAISGSVFYFMFQLTINYFDRFSKEFNTIISFAYLLGTLCFVMCFSGKEIEKGKPRNLMLNISLKVLADIEKEKPKQIKENQRTDISATTITAKEKLHEYSEKRHDKKK